MSEKKFERDTAEEYRVAAERDLRRRLDELALSLGVPQSDGEKGSGVCSEAAATTAAGTRDTAAGAGAKIDGARTLSAETAERILRTLGADRRKAKTLARVLDFRADDDALRALAQAVGYAADASRADKAGGIHGGHRRRLRESARRDGDLDAFSDIEILETLLSFVIPQRNTNPLAHRLLDRFGSLLGVFRAERAALYEVSGMTRAAAGARPTATCCCTRSAPIWRRRRASPRSRASISWAGAWAGAISRAYVCIASKSPKRVAPTAAARATSPRLRAR